MIETLTKQHFDPHLNSTFEIHTNSVGTVEVELVEISEASHPGVESFSLLFRGPTERIFEQKIQKVTHPKMGEFDLFMGPVIHEKKDGIYYQAVFSRLKKPAGRDQ